MDATTGRYRWVVLASGTFAQTSYSAIWLGVAVMAPALRSGLHLSLGQTGVLLSASLAGSVLSLIPWGLATDRFGERRVLIVGLVLCGAALIGASQAHRFASLAALLAAAGLTARACSRRAGGPSCTGFRPRSEASRLRSVRPRSRSAASPCRSRSRRWSTRAASPGDSARSASRASPVPRPAS